MTVLELPARAKRAVSRLEENGFEAFAVGGCVRDLLLGKAPGDIDLTTSARPEEVKAAFPDCRALDTGLRHGTVTLLWEGEPLEVTTYRVERGYSDGRHPDAVFFSSSLADDLARRDFTINGMAYCDRAGFIDLHGGLADLKAGWIRPIGEGRARFLEDALRILRAFRFMAKLGFSLAPGTGDAIRDCAPLLSNIPAERITAELRGVLEAPAPGSALQEMERLGVLPEFLPSLPEGLPALLTESPALFPLRLALLLSPLDEGEAERRLSFLRLSRREREQTATLLARRDLPPPTGRAEILRLLRELSPEGFRRFCQYRAALRPPQADSFHAADALAGELLAAGECWHPGLIAIRGGDLAELGLRGPEIGRMLERLWGEVAEGGILNEREALLRYCRTRKLGK